jgi:hypothetical protein
MSTAIIVIVIVLLVLVAVGAFLAAKRKREREALQERFGPEYDRAVEQQGGRRQAEHRLADVADRRDKAEIRDLEPAERERYSRRWTDVQGAFVDDPVGAARDADALVGDVMRDRGYPLDDVDDRADLVATDHAELAGHYRAAHAVGQRAEDASTEELRQAFVHYRALFVELLAEPQGRHGQAAEVADSTDGERDRSAPTQTPPV